MFRAYEQQTVPAHFELLDRQYEILDGTIADVGGRAAMDLFDPAPDEPDEPAPLALGIRHDTGIKELDLLSIPTRFETASSQADKHRFALEFISRPFSLDWAKHVLTFDPTLLDDEGEEVTTQDETVCTHYLDLLHVHGKPFAVLAASSSYFSSFQLMFSQWASPFRATHDIALPFNLSGKTFFLGKHQRLKWYIVMHPIVMPTTVPKFQPSRTNLSQLHATQLLAYMISLFQTAEMYHVNIRPSTHPLGIGEHVTIAAGDFHRFQTNLMASWRANMQTMTSDAFWHQHLPCLHVYDYGMNEQLSGENTVGNHLSQSFISKFDINSIAAMSTAIASEVDLLQETSYGRVRRALLANATKLKQQFQINSEGKSLDIFPIAFSSQACNFQSYKPPKIIERGLARHQRTVSENNLGESILTYGPCQGYNIMKQRVRNALDDFQLGRGYYTGSYCVPKELMKHGNVRRKREKMLEHCKTHRPYRHMIDALRCAEAVDKVRFRIETIYILDIAKLKEVNRSFEYVSQSILQPLCEIWTNKAFVMVSEFCDPYPTDVFPICRNSITDRSFPPFILSLLNCTSKS